jgi:hypothetical protein
MEILVTTISFVLLIGLFVSPILILIVLNRLNIKYKFIFYLILAIVITSIITLTFGWWADTSYRILLAHYGYYLDAMNDAERFANVSVENMERVKRLEISMLGIGWPLKALMGYVVFSPYLLIVYLIAYLRQKSKK